VVQRRALHEIEADVGHAKGADAKIPIGVCTTLSDELMTPSRTLHPKVVFRSEARMRERAVRTSATCRLGGPGPALPHPQNSTKGYKKVGGESTNTPGISHSRRTPSVSSFPVMPSVPANKAAPTAAPFEQVSMTVSFKKPVDEKPADIDIPVRIR
jgi:hypothetical protein